MAPVEDVRSPIGLPGESAFSPEERHTLLALAREAIEAHVRRARAPGKGERGTPRLEAPGAAFVTLRRSDGELRGCIGTTRFERPLVDLVPDLAVSSASSDRRFDPVEPGELDDLRISISVLSPLEPARLGEIEIGRHGLVVRRGGSSGLLLPQVASERGWDERTFLEETSRKAGLGHDAWRKPDATVLWFTAESFGE
ncbi:AmmeMemoRadiSam system protein A [bacterium]|nr:AmmeMemoRadiSam system protein A [bacterium]